MAVAEYLLKVILCSAAFNGYYWLALRNKLFHEWNRFYLLGALIFSLTIPLIKFTIWQKAEEQPAATYQVLQKITTEDKWFEETELHIRNTSPVFSVQNITTYIYLLVSIILFLLLILALIRIRKLFKTHPHWKINELVFVDTEANGTPFSFFKYIFWNRKIDFESEKGQQIFSHELIHIKEKHSWDKLFINILLIPFWINPFFWFIKKELTLIHEFIADKKSVANGDASAFAAMILAAAFPGQMIPLTNPFYYSSIKRRLRMLSKLNNPKTGYIGRLLLLPVLALLFFAFVLKTKELKNISTGIQLFKEYVVVIDAGHGLRDGKHDGAKSEDGYTEDEFTLAIAKKIESLNKNEKIRILLTRKNESFIPLKERTEYTHSIKPDLFISLHAMYAAKLKDGITFRENPAKGIEAYVSVKNETFAAQNKFLASLLLEEVSLAIPIQNRGIKTKQQGIWVIDNSPSPAALLELGFLSNKEDLKILKDEEKQKQLATSILKGIERYVKALEKGEVSFNNLSTNSASLYVQNTKDTVPDTRATIPDSIKTKLESPNGGNELVIINGKVADKNSLNRKIVSADKLTVLPKNSAEAIKKYGAAAKNGVIIMENVKFEGEAFTDSIPKQSSEPLFTEAEVMPQFPGGESAWNKHIQNYIEKNIDTIVNAAVGGTCEVKFIVKKNGKISDITFLSLQNTILAKTFQQALEEGADWIPAMQNGKKVDCWKTQRLTFRLPDDPVDSRQKQVSVANAGFKILYLGMDNLLVISLGSIPENRLVVTINNGTISKKNGEWIAQPASLGEAIVTISDIDSKVNKSQFVFKVLSIPDPVISIGGSKGGRIRADVFKDSKNIEATLLHEDAKVVNYTFYITGKGFETGAKVVPGVQSNEFNKTILELLEKAGPGSTVVIDEIKVMTKNGKVKAPTVAFNLY